MQYALILETELTTDAPRRERLIDVISHLRGVLRVDTEMASSGLLLADLVPSADASLLMRLDGVEAVESMGVKSIASDRDVDDLT